MTQYDKQMLIRTITVRTCYVDNVLIYLVPVVDLGNGGFMQKANEGELLDYICMN